MFPLHHGDAETSGNWVQRVNDSDGGVLAANVLHTAGALFFTAGIILFLYIARNLRTSGSLSPTGAGLVRPASWFTLAGVVTNGIGGIMRLYQSDHPSLTQVGESLWVQVLLIKHLFLIAGVGLAVYLIWRSRDVASDPELMADPARESDRWTWFALASVASILAATVLGAVASNASLGEPAPLDSGGGSNFPQDPRTLGPGLLAEASSSGTLTGLPMNPDTDRHEFLVPEGTDLLVVEVRWTMEQAEFAVNVADASGAPLQGTETTSVTTMTWKHEGTLAQGTYVIDVSSEQSLQETYSLTVRAVQSLGGANVVQASVPVATGEFFEVNLLMPTGSNISWAWWLEDENETIYFDVHLHPGDEVTYPVQGEWSQHNGTYTHDGSTQGPSLLWANEDHPHAMTVSYKVWGDFAVHSYFPDEP